MVEGLYGVVLPSVVVLLCSVWFCLEISLLDPSRVFVIIYVLPYLKDLVGVVVSVRVLGLGFWKLI